MKPDEKNLEEILRLPAGSREEMNHALNRVLGRLRENTLPEEYFFEVRPSRWARTALLTAATILIAAVLVGVIWNSRVYGVLQNPDGSTEWIYAETAFGGDGGVLTLRDESKVEIRPKSDVRVQPALDGVRIRLQQGTIIVSAAKQRLGHLYVQTKDMTVSVVGTVFIVNAEADGSRVSVLEGEVQVQQGSSEKQLRSGEQSSTSLSMTLPPMKEAVSWSPNAVEHIALLDKTPEPEWQRDAGGKMAFVDATVRPSDSRDPGSFPLSIDNVYRSTGGVFRASFPLRHYIEFAYKLSLTPAQREAWLAQVPKWVETDNFSIDAKAPTNNPTKDQMRLMMQRLLAEKFKLAVRFEQKQMPVFALTLIRPGTLGPQLLPHDDGPPCPAKRSESDLFPKDIDSKVWPYYCDSVILVRPGVSPARLGPEVKKSSEHSQLVAGRNIPLEVLLDSFMSSSIGMGSPLVDRTGLTGSFDFSLEWLPDTPDAFSAAMNEQLGMKLEATTASVPVLIVDRVEKPSGN